MRGSDRALAVVVVLVLLLLLVEGITAKGAFEPSRLSRACISRRRGKALFSLSLFLSCSVWLAAVRPSETHFNFLRFIWFPSSSSSRKKKKKLFFLGRPLRSYDCALVYFYASRSKILIGRYMEPISLRTVWNRDGNRYMGGHCCAISFPISFVSPFSLDIRFFVYWFVDSPSWRDQTDPTLHLKKKKKAAGAPCRFISYGNGPNESDRIFFFRGLFIPWIPPGTTIYISLSSLINRKQIPL